MTQMVLNIDSKKKLNAIKTILNAMNIEYTTQDAKNAIGEKERALLDRAKQDVAHGRLSSYTSHRDILKLIGI